MILATEMKMSGLNCNGNHNFELGHKDSVVMEETHNECHNHTPSESASTSESVIYKSSVAVQQKTPKVLRPVLSKGKVSTIQKISLPTLLIILLILVVAMFQIPTVLYYTDPPATDDFPLNGINLESCTVSL